MYIKTRHINTTERSSNGITHWQWLLYQHGTVADLAQWEFCFVRRLSEDFNSWSQADVRSLLHAFGSCFCHFYLVRWLMGLGFVGFLFPCISSESWGKFMVEHPKTSGRMGRPWQTVWQIRNLRISGHMRFEVFESSLELRRFLQKAGRQRKTRWLQTEREWRGWTKPWLGVLIQGILLLSYIGGSS